MPAGCANPYAAELGYWLARPYRGKGLMGAAAARLVDHGFRALGFRRIYAYVFETNIASVRVLEKNGFSLEGRLLKHAYKDSRFIDARLYAKLS